jgi:lipoprotein-anchoring transpeptidase ErfK/SrfK
MNRFATALAGLLCASPLLASPASARPFNPFDPFGLTNPAEEYYGDVTTGSVRQSTAVDPYGQAYGSSYADPYAGEQAQVAPIPREIVAFSGYAPGTIVVNTAERRLYYVMGDGTAMRYGVGVGRPGFTWGGTQRVTRKAEWPGWTPPAEMIRRRPDLPKYMAGGIDNPLGARAMYLGSSLYRIHGSNEPDTIGQAVSSGCIRMTNDDVVDLYNRVRVGAQVVVLR